MTPEQAMEAYRQAWTGWCLSVDFEHKYRLEQTMDALQPKIARGPWDPTWQQFASSLPGFNEFWANWREAVTAEQ